MTERKTLIRILSSPVFVATAVFILHLVKGPMWFLPLFIGVAVSLFNLGKVKFSPQWTGVLIAILQSYGVFLGLSIVIFLLDEYIPEIYITDNQFDLKGIILVTFGGYLAALLLFYFYSFLFKIENKKFGVLVITICYAFVILMMQIFSKNEFLQFGVEKFTSFIISWLIFMSLAFGIALNYPNLYNSKN